MQSLRRESARQDVVVVPDEKHSRKLQPSHKVRILTKGRGRATLASCHVLREETNSIKALQRAAEGLRNGLIREHIGLLKIDRGEDRREQSSMIRNRNERR